ncbi:50S ribosomal protein L30 [Acidaminobacter hydrogenoformans]|uniref:Large ribosomal subunit protein uL30 n=1 Tax=Acidaminobacter hydrogenoformans DSM 2784 TaxID=1120920 RepID=A0A1G5S6G5_9FIRM|nr:50S ribosomal protein L30 [Acidaminobacter hydrogenoformans]SCZ81903.1 LSU ribosomal protein L30P [Acidaminobacter hydrogenoformans DSM 2784]
MANTIKVKLVKSTIGAIPKHKKTIEALGLRKIGQVVEKQDNPQMRGMIQQVSHLVKIVEA